MKRLLAFLIMFAGILSLNAQKDIGSLSAITGEANLKAVLTLSPYSSAVGFDSRYQGIRGTPRLLDTLVNSLVLIRGQEKYYRMETDIDVVRNAVVFRLKPGEGLMEILADNIIEIIMDNNGKELVFKTTDGIDLEKKQKEIKFYTVIKEGPRQFIKVPDKLFVEADYKRVYSQDRRYDEFKDDNKYYIMGSDSVFHRVQLTRKSLAKLFPDSRQVILDNFNEKSSADPETDVARLLERF